MAEAVALMLEQQNIACNDSPAKIPQSEQIELHMPHLASSHRRRSSRSSRSNNFFTTPAFNLAGGSDGKEAGMWDVSRLYMHEELPAELAFNVHIRSGYRAGLSPGQCVCSILEWHNETGNILTHLLPLLLLVFALLTGWLQWWPGNAREFGITVAPIMICLSGSVVYHCFMANHSRYHMWISLDVCSIFVLLIGSFFYPLWWGFHCFPTIRLSFAIAYYTAACAAVLTSLRAKNAVWRALPMATLFCVRLAVTVARFALGAGHHMASWHYLLMEAFSATGGFLNAMRIPECWFPVEHGTPGRFDYLFNSHQLMHILVVVSMAHLFVAASLDHGHYIISIC